MFTTKTRRFPSKAALRVLCQLAYISSGTAVGVGMLCAEERRRRTQIVQRIADNAKRIRQHPRYVAGSALAMREGDGEGDGVEGRGWYGVEEVVKQGGEGKKAKKRGKGSLRADDGIKGQHLPSVVEQEYGAVSAGKRKRRAMGNASEPRPAYLNHDMPKSKGSRVPRIGPDHYEQTNAASRRATYRQPDRRSTSATYSSGQPPWSSLHRKSSEQTDGQREDPDDTLDSMPTTSQVASSSLTGLDRSDWTQNRCRTLLDDGRTSEAVDFYVWHMRQSQHTRLKRHGVQRVQAPGLHLRLFDQALEQKIFQGCADLLRLHTEYDLLFSSRCQALIRACGIHGESDVLLDLLFRGDRMLVDLDWLRFDQDAMMILTTACSTDDNLFGRFEELYRALTEASRRTIDKQRCHMLLRVVWRSTKNMDAVLEKLRPMVKHLEDINDVKALWAVDSTMADIYVSAGKTNDALDTIARMHKAEPSGALCISLAAYAFAKQHAWKPLYQVLEVAESRGSFTSITRRKAHNRLHNIVFVYSQEHSAAQTWKFVTYLQDKLHYRPSGYANRVILEAFVARKAISLVPKWLRALRIDGNEFKINGNFAARLLGRYYHEHRPSHVLTMWFCRNLAHLCPSFDPNEFFDLIKQSISYDVGGGFERSAVWQRDHAEQRLDLLQDADGHVPSPGYKHSRNLHFRHPQANNSCTAPASGGHGVEIQNSALGTVGPAEGSDKTSDGSLHIIKANEELKNYHGARTSEAASVEAQGDGPQALPSDFSHGSDNSQTPNEDENGLDGLFAAMPKKGSRRQRSIVDDMRVELSRHKYSSVLNLYERCLDGIGVPISPLALDIAVRASLKLHGHDGHAQHIIGSAERSGMNVIRALAPVVIHNIQKYDPTDRDTANKLLDTTKRFYGMSDVDGSIPGHHVGVTAANMLITNGRPGLGVNLLRSILDSDWRKKRSVDIVLMQVMVKGYIALNIPGDVMFWAREALRLNIRVSPNFVRELKRALNIMKGLSRRERMHLGWYVEACRKRRFEQAHEAKMLGKQLVATIARCMREETTVDIDARVELDRELFGATRKDPRKVAAQKNGGELEQGANQGLGRKEDQLKTAPLTRRQRMLQRRKERVAESIRHDPNAIAGNARHARHLDHMRWMREYRAFLRKPIVLEDGNYAPYRYHLPSESTGWRAREKISQTELRTRRELFWDEGEGE